MSGPGVPGLLAMLSACGAHVTAQGDTLALSGKRPPVPLLDDLKARKLEVLAYLRDAAPEDRAASLPSPESYVTKTASVEVRAREVVQSVNNLPALPDWAQIAAQPGRCGSCAHAQDAPEWGALMVSCGCDPAAWWPLPAPLALHVGALCGAYLQSGETVGQGYRARGSVRSRGRA